MPIANTQNTRSAGTRHMVKELGRVFKEVPQYQGLAPFQVVIG